MRRSGWAGAAVGAVLAGAVSLVVRRDLTRFEIVEESMAPVLLPGDYVTARRLRHPPDRGDVVVYTLEGRDDFALVKRVIGVGGDTVHVAGGAVLVDGEPDTFAVEPTPGEGTWTLDADEVFVLGDQRARSKDDSRTRGPIPVSAARWRVAWRYWPPGRIGRVG